MGEGQEQNVMWLVRAALLEDHGIHRKGEPVEIWCNHPSAVADTVEGIEASGLCGPVTVHAE